jgi:MDMPI C-terminal domain
VNVKSPKFSEQFSVTFTRGAGDVNGFMTELTATCGGTCKCVLNVTAFDDVPQDVCAALVDDVAAALRTRPDCPAVELREAEGIRTWRLDAPSSATPVVVSGDLPSLAAYATGRPMRGPVHSVGQRSLPKLPAWL